MFISSLLSKDQFLVNLAKGSMQDPISCRRQHLCVACTLEPSVETGIGLPTPLHVPLVLLSAILYSKRYHVPVRQLGGPSKPKTEICLRSKAQWIRSIPAAAQNSHQTYFYLNGLLDRFSSGRSLPVFLLGKWPDTALLKFFEDRCG
jgi:hypothetical protein